MLNQLLIIALCFISLFQPTRQRTLIAMGFSVTCMVHAMVSSYLSDVLYYLTAGYMDLIILVFVCLLARPTRFIDMVIIVLISSICLNVYGWVLYESFSSPIAYNKAFSCLYLIAIYIFLKKEPGNENSSFNWFRFPDVKRDNLCYSLHKKA